MRRFVGAFMPLFLFLVGSGVPAFAVDPCATSGIACNAAAVYATPPTRTDQTGATLTQTPSGALRVQPQDGAGHDVSSATPLPVQPTAGVAQVSSQAPMLCGTASSVVYTGGSATNGFVRFKVQEGSAVGVYFSWVGVVATTASGELLAPGESIVWGALANSVTCVTTSGSATVVVTQ